MQNTRLTKLLKALSPREIVRFQEYISSPFFNKNQKVLQLAAHILPAAPHFAEPLPLRRELFQLIFPGDTYSDGRINNIISDLLHLLYSFLAYLQFEGHPPQQINYLLDQLLQRESHHDVQRAAKRYQAAQQKNPFRNYEFFLEEYAFYNQLDRYFFTKNKREYDENLQLKSDNLDLYYFSNKLRIACDMLTRNTVAKASYECHFLEEILEQYDRQKEHFTRIPALQVYYQVLQMLQQTDAEDYYFGLKKLLEEKLHLFPQEELRVLFTYAINYCIKQINSGKSNYYREVLELYQRTLEQEIIFKNGYLTSWTFKNIITVGIRLNEFAWVEQFIYQYQNNLLPEEKNNAVAFNLASLFYAQKNYHQALRQLHRIDFSNTSYHLGAKIIQIKSYFELEETEPLYALIEAARKYVVRSSQLSEYGKKANNNFLKLTRKLYQLKLRKSQLTRTALQKKKQLLQEQLQAAQLIANKDWLEEVFGKI